MKIRRLTVGRGTGVQNGSELARKGGGSRTETKEENAELENGKEKRMFVLMAYKDCDNYREHVCASYSIRKTVPTPGGSSSKPCWDTGNRYCTAGTPPTP